MRWIIDERPSRNVGLDKTWWDWLKGLGLWDSLTGLDARSWRSCDTLLISSWEFGLNDESFDWVDKSTCEMVAQTRKTTNSITRSTGQKVHVSFSRAAEDWARLAPSSVHLRESSNAAVGLITCASHDACRTNDLLSI